MKISAVSLDRFRGVSQLDVTLDPNMTVFVGMNGVGKSSILDAIAMMLYQIEGIWSSERTRLQFPTSIFKGSDVQAGEDEYRLKLHFILQDLIGEDNELVHEFGLSDARFYRSSASLEEIRQFVTKRTFPTDNDLLIYYRQDRGFDDRLAYKSSDLKSSLFGPLRAISELESWWDQRDAEEARHVRDVDRNFRDPQLQAVRALIREVDGFKGIKFSSNEDPAGIYFERTDGVRIHVGSLSSGERSFIIILADLARRLQQSRPDVPLGEIPAVVLIDEIELNLHPSWQSKIISTLSRVFKSCQFIITTHSPQVISSVKSEHVRVLSKNGGTIEVKLPHRTKGQTSNYLLEGIFESHERFPEIDILIEAFNDAVDTKKPEQATWLLDQITSQIEGDPPEMLVLRKRLKGLQQSS